MVPAVPIPETPPEAPAGLVLLTGGASRRLGAPKHAQAHPDGGTWSSRLMDLFHEVLGEGPVRVLGEPVPDRPGLTVLDDPREGPALALARWAAGERAAARRWWVVPCDQVRWRADDLRDWHGRAAAADPWGRAWVLARVQGEAHPLGGFLGGALLPALAAARERRLVRLAASLPHLELDAREAPFLDVDDPEARRAWLRARGGA